MQLLILLCAARAAAQESNDLYDQPVLAVDPGMHSGVIRSLAADAQGRFAITGGSEGSVKIWSVLDGKLVRTIWIPVGPDAISNINALAISPDGSEIAIGAAWTIYLFDRESGAMVGRLRGEKPNQFACLSYSFDGRYLAATLLGKGGLRVFDRNKDWGEAFRDDNYGGRSYGVSFARDGRLATTSIGSEGTIRVYDADFRLVSKPIKAPSGNVPYGIAFSPDGQFLAVGYKRLAAVDVLNGHTLDRAAGPKAKDFHAGPDGLALVAWSADGQTLFAAGSPTDAGQFALIAWDTAALDKERRLSVCGSGAIGINPLPNGTLLVASSEPCFALIGPQYQPIWTSATLIAEFADPDFVTREPTLMTSTDGTLIDFGFGGETGKQLRFDVRSLRLGAASPKAEQTIPPNREGLPIAGWRNGRSPTLGGIVIPIEAYGLSRSLALSPDKKRFYVGSSFFLTAFDDTGTVRWQRPTPGETLAVNASMDGRILVAAYSDGTIRWHRAKDGHELLALIVLADRTNWVLWTPEGFFEATDGAGDVLKWVVNHGTDSAASTLPVSAIPKLHRPDALPFVLDQLETARALGIADVAAARLSVQSATGSAEPPGAILHVLTVGINLFGDKAGGLKLDYAVDDARDVANALLASQKGGLYADVKLQVLQNEEADGVAILNAMNTMAQGMRASNSDQDMAVILFSSHGEILDDQFYLIPYGFDVSSTGAMEKSSISVDEFARKVSVLAGRGKVLLLLDACHSGVVGPGGAKVNQDTSVLRNAVNRDNVTVLTSSQRDELSQELPAWRHGAFTQAFLDALSGLADPEGHGFISTNKLADAMDKDLKTLTKNKQHLGERLNFSGDVFVVSR